MPSTNFTVEETRVGQRTDFDRLTLHIETDGSVEPDRAVAYAAELVRKHLEYMLYFSEGGIPEVSVPGASPVPERLQDLFERPIEDLAELSVRSRNSLQKENIRTLGDLVQRSEDAMLQIENFGKKSLAEIGVILETMGLKFGMDIDADKLDITIPDPNAYRYQESVEPSVDVETSAEPIEPVEPV